MNRDPDGANPSEARDSPADLAKRLGDLTPTARAALLRRLGREILPGPELVARALEDCGVQRLSGIMGTPADGVFSSCQKRMRVLGFRHQMNAVLAAAADNYASGGLVHAVCVSAGPAIMNGLTGVYFARDNHFPLLFLGTRRSLEDEGRGYFQELDAVPILAPLTKWAATVSKTADIMPMIQEGVQIAIDGQPGPVFLNLPENVLAGSGPPAKLGRPERKVDLVSEDDVGEALRLLRSARAPLLCLGEDLRWETDLESLLRFIEREGIPWMTMPMARGILPEDHPLCANSARRRLPRQCDCFFLAGGWFDWRLRFGAEISSKAKVIHVHPQEERLGRNIATELKVKSQPGAFLNAIVQRALVEPAPVQSRSPWLELVRDEGEREVRNRRSQSRELSAGMDPSLVYDAVQDSLPVETMMTVDGNITLAFVQFAISPGRPWSWLDPGWNGLIGGSLGLAIGLKLARPECPVVAFMSDTSFGMVAMEVETCARLGISVIVLIGNNGGNTGNHRDREFFPKGADPVSTYGLLPYHQVGRSLGLDAAELRDIDEVAPALSRAFALQGPSCLNLILDPDSPHPGFW